MQQRIGRNGDGVKWIYDTNYIRERSRTSSCFIYTLGSNGEFGFEIELKHSLAYCDIHTFDMNSHSCPINVCNMHQERLGNGHNGSKSLIEVITELNHIHRPLEILKIDIEGSEFSLFDDFFERKDALSVHARQILSEIHLPKVLNSINVTEQVDVKSVHRLFRLLHHNNYVIFHKVNLYDLHTTFEYSMLRLHRSFFLKKEAT